MSPRALAVALLVVSVALAGCGTAVGPTATASPTPTPPPTATPSPDGTAPSLPPGVTAAGVADPVALTNAHATVLTDASFSVAANSTQRYENGTLRIHETTTGTFARNKDRYAVDYAVAGTVPSLLGSPSGRLSAWADGEGIYQRIETNGSPSYQRLYDANGDLRDPREHILADKVEEDRLYILFSAFEFSVERVSRDGGTRYRLVSGTVSDPGSVASVVDADSVRQANLTALVDSRGVVREYRLEYVGSIGNRTIYGVHAVRYDGIGNATVERPDWVDEAENATSG